MHKMATVVCLAFFVSVLFIGCSANNESHGNSAFRNEVDFSMPNEGEEMLSQNRSKYSDKYESFILDDDAFNHDSTSDQQNLSANSSGGTFSHTWKLQGVILERLDEGDVAKVKVDKDSDNDYLAYIRDEIYVDLRRLNEQVTQDEIGKTVDLSILPWIGEGVAFPTKWEILD